MNSTIFSQGSGSCTANITKTRNRLKIYPSNQSKSKNGLIFLKDKDNFEIELFNPHTVKVLAKIYINGKIISNSGIVLKPGERVFLDRFIDDNNKFEFSTYSVENSKASITAIQDNGIIRVEFYHQLIPQTNQNYWYGGSTGLYSNPDPFTINSPSTGNPIFLTQNSDANNFFFSTCGTTNISDYSIGSTLTSYSSNNLEIPKIEPNKRKKESKSLETGTIEMGGISNQKFETVYGNFNTFYTECIDFQILPVSNKPVEISEVRNYCPFCQCRVKDKNWRFCPKCGNKF